MRIENFEFFFNEEPEHIDGHVFTRNPEIVAYNATEDGEEYRYTILFYEKGREGYEIRFIGSRPLEFTYKDKDILWELMQYGQTVLDAKFNLNQKIKQL
jgi:hypothetical protein